MKIENQLKIVKQFRIDLSFLEDLSDEIFEQIEEYIENAISYYEELIESQEEDEEIDYEHENYIFIKENLDDKWKRRLGDGNICD